MNNPNESILTTELGTPIGEVVIADNTSLPPVPTAASIEENRSELLRATAVEVTGDPDADKAVAELYPGYMDAEKRKLAMTAFVVQGRTVEESALAAGVPERTVAMWAYNGRWDQLVKREVAAMETKSKLELAKFRAQRRMKIVKAQLEQAEELRDTAIEKMKAGEASVKSATEAWAAASKVEHTLTGLSEAGTVADVDGGGGSGSGKGDGKQPLVVIVQGGGLVPVRRAE